MIATATNPAITLRIDELPNLPSKVGFLDWLSVFVSFRDPGINQICSYLADRRVDVQDSSTYESIEKWTQLPECAFCFTRGQGLKIQFQGSHFHGNNINDDLDFVKSFCSHFTEVERFFVSRIDYSHNMELCDIKQLSVRCQPRTFISDFHKGGINLGVSIGRRGSEYCQLRIYHKALDPHRRSAFLRFGSTDFVRLEWEIGKDKLSSSSRSLETITPISIFTDWRRVLASRFPFLDGTEEPDAKGLRERFPVDARTETGVWKYPLETICSIIRNHILSGDSPDESVRFMIDWLANGCPEDYLTQINKIKRSTYARLAGQVDAGNTPLF